MYNVISTPSFLLAPTLIQAITKQLETLTDICLSTKPQLTSSISACGDEREYTEGGKGVERDNDDLT